MYLVYISKLSGLRLAIYSSAVHLPQIASLVSETKQEVVWLYHCEIN